MQLRLPNTMGEGELDKFSNPGTCGMFKDLEFSATGPPLPSSSLNYGTYARSDN